MAMQTLLAVALLASIDVATAQRAFAELDAMCAQDNGRLWGRTLCGPIVFADPKTREAMTKDGPATIPDSIGIANTAVEWNSRRWTMVMWPLPDSVVARRVVLAHESFHRIQPELRLPASNPANAHLDTADGRYWMRLELRALARALATKSEEAVTDALAFRAERRALFAHAAEEERLLEMNEGLSEHTGYAMAISSPNERIVPLVRRLHSAGNSERLARSFAYVTGAAWGTLIEMRDRGWTRRVKASDDLGALAGRAWKIAPAPLHPERYGGAEVRADEDARAEKKRQMYAALQAKFIDGPVLVIDFVQMSFTFDPNNVQPFAEHGNVYPSMEVRDTWGKIVVTGGALMSADYKKLTVPANGDGYTLTLAEGWEVRDGRVVKRGND